MARGDKRSITPADVWEEGGRKGSRRVFRRQLLLPEIRFIFYFGKCSRLAVWKVTMLISHSPPLQLSSAVISQIYDLLKDKIAKNLQRIVYGHFLIILFSRQPPSSSSLVLWRREGERRVTGGGGGGSLMASYQV